jgi:hypothetical protein
MKFQLLFSLFFVFLVNSINSQTYKLEYAQKLSGQFNFVEAYPVWEDLSNVFLKKQKGDWEYLRQAAKAAEKSEQYEKALYWIKILVDKNKALAKDYPSYFSLRNREDRRDLHYSLHERYYGVLLPSLIYLAFLLFSVFILPIANRKSHRWQRS